MLTVATRLRVLVFLVIGVLALSYVGLRYADLGRYVGYKNYYVVKVEMTQGGGLLQYADVTYNGVSVGRVGPMKLTPTGVEAELRIKKNAPKIPANIQAQVANRSAVGEQYIDLRPTGAGGPYLASGSRVARAAVKTPPPVTDLLLAMNDFAASVPLDDLRTVVDEAALAFNGQSQNLQVLLDSGSAFTREANRHVKPTTELIVDGEHVMRTQNQEAEALKAFGRNAQLLARQLRTSDADFRRLISVAPGAAEQFAGLVRDLDPDLSVVVANLLTTSELFRTRIAGTEELLVKVPQAVAAGSSMIKNGRLNFGMVTTFFQPMPCTKGYESTRYRNGLDTGAGPPLNTAAKCTMPASSWTNVRGAANAPKGGVPDDARPGSVGLPDPATSVLPGALGLPALPAGGPADMGGLLGLGGVR
ncbi:MCE family protein [Thermomonospora umbrina]|uniref:Phospholipid/cholesterol/gamma-HCH transport system substrate-binding protein n=1 Tax=Thermomonospora umbrina TaxID=111806 RepID=A0A3D9SPC2_9ACTN|nr:MlaD family protein [Thermomonospora umbrina]REE97812.1 phospholipid/cholesterol/gamma-HCH transport system substrate-binding protein [Thermomonospora umbrina]